MKTGKTSPEFDALVHLVLPVLLADFVKSCGCPPASPKEFAEFRIAFLGHLTEKITSEVQGVRMENLEFCVANSVQIPKVPSTKVRVDPNNPDILEFIL